MSARRRKQTACTAEDAPLSPAVVRLYARAMEIENEIEEAVADGDYMTIEELLAWSDRLRNRTLDIDAEEAAAKARLMSEHREYQWTKRELGRLLGLGPEDINPLERSEPGGPDDLRTRRALWLSFRLNEAYLDQLLWWRQPPRLRVMIALNDYQLALIMDLATPLARKQRSAFLETVAARLEGRRVGDGTLYRVALAVQRELLGRNPTREDAHAVAGELRPGR